MDGVFEAALHLFRFVVDQADLAQADLVYLTKLRNDNLVEVTVSVPMVLLKRSQSGVLINLRTVLGVKNLEWEDAFLLGHYLGHVRDIAHIHR